MTRTYSYWTTYWKNMLSHIKRVLDLKALGKFEFTETTYTMVQNVKYNMKYVHKLFTLNQNMVIKWVFTLTDSSFRGLPPQAPPSLRPRPRLRASPIPPS